MSTVDVMPVKEINFGPATVREEVLQNVATLLTTIKYSVPYDRALGIDPVYLDDPTPVTRARLTANIIATLRKHEPRATVVSINFKEDPLEGRLIPIARVAVNV